MSRSVPDRGKGDAHHRDVERVEEERAAEHEQGAPGAPGQLVGGAERRRCDGAYRTRINSFALLFDRHRTYLFDGCQTIVASNDGIVPRDRRELESAPDLDAVDGMTVLQALSDPVRLEIVRQLAGLLGRGRAEVRSDRAPGDEVDREPPLQDPVRRRHRRRARAGHEQVHPPPPRRARASGSRACSTRCCRQRRSELRRCRRRAAVAAPAPTPAVRRQRDLRDDARAAARRALDSEPAVERGEAVGQAAQARAAARGRRRRRRRLRPRSRRCRSSAATRTSTAEASACLTTFVTASATT